MNLPSNADIKSHVVASLRRYWLGDFSYVSQLPITRIVNKPSIVIPLRLSSVSLPPWADSFGVNGCILVPKEILSSSISNCSDWRSVDWWLAAFLMLEGWHERLWECKYGPIHSYSISLSNWDQRAWHYAWVNRIALFLRQWAIQCNGPAAEQHLGNLPAAEIRMTHDVDALSKTLPIRLKQGAFNLFNAARALRQGQFSNVCRHFHQATRFLLGCENWWVFDRLIALESEARIIATYHFYAEPRSKTFKRWLLDPSYSIEELAQSGLLQQLKKYGHHIGLHPGFDTWRSAAQLDAAREHLQRATGFTAIHVRQHWLRFSWSDTWNAQSVAGLKQDTTLMFNDRPGYRTSSALAWKPWNPASDAAHLLTALPTVLMDSHCYDYQPMTAEQRRQSIQHWIGECQAVRGQVAVLWHPHTLSHDYGWSQGFNDTISTFAGNSV